MTKSRRAWVVSSALTVAVLTGVELGFRIAGVPEDDPIDIITELDAHRLSRNRPGLSIREFRRRVPVTTNRFGLRGRETAPVKPPGVYRIVALGDSTTFGYGVGDEETFCAVLERLLNRDRHPGDPRFEVVNAGVIGYTSFQGLRTLTELVLPFRPDCLVVSFALNDSYEDLSLRDFLGRRRPDVVRMSPAVVFLRNLLWNHSLACRWVLRDGLRRLWDYRYARMAAEGERAGWKRGASDYYKENLREFVRLARANRTDLVFLPLPVRLKSSRFPPYRMNRVVRDRRAAQGALRDMDGVIARTSSAIDRSAMWYAVAKLREALGDSRGALDAYLEALSCGRMPSDPRWGGYVHANLMAEVAIRERVPLANVLPEFCRRELSDNPVDLYIDNYHPGSLGHRIIASALESVVADLARRPAGP